jgi:hypothetical protein
MTIPDKCPTCDSNRPELRKLVADDICHEYGGPTLYDPCQDKWHDTSLTKKDNR